MQISGEMSNFKIVVVYFLLLNQQLVFTAAQNVPTAAQNTLTAAPTLTAAHPTVYIVVGARKRVL